MKDYRILALRELSSQKLTSFLILIAVVLSAAMTAAVGQSVGVLSAMRQQQAITIGGNRHATFVQRTKEEVEMLKQDPRLSWTGCYVSLGSQKLNDQLALNIEEYQDGSLASRPSYSRLAKGRLPEAPLELALPEDVLQFPGFDGNIKVGDRVTLSLSKALRHGIVTDAYDYTAEFTLTGILESNYLGYTSGYLLGLAGQGTAEAVLPPDYLYYNADIRVADRKDFQAVMDDLCGQMGIHELDTLYNIPLLNALGIPYDSDAADSELAVDDAGFSWLMASGILVAALILLAAGMVIYNILRIAVSRRIGQYGTLRAIGAEAGQLYTVAVLEVLFLCTVGIPAGLLLGWLSARGILTAALNQLSPEVFLAEDAERLESLIAANSQGKWGYLLLSAAVTLVSAFLASVPAARFAARVSPVTALAGVPCRIRRRNRTTKRIRNFERYYAWLNVCRSKGRSAVTILSLAMSITVFIVLQSFLSLLGVSGSVPEHLGDYSVVNQYAGIPPEELAELKRNDSVDMVAAEQFSLYMLDEQNCPSGIETDLVLGAGETFQIFGLNDCWMDDVFASRLTPEQLNLLKAGDGCVVRNPIPMEFEGVTVGTTCVEAGTVITVAGRKLNVLLSLNGYDGYFSVGSSGFINGVQVLVSDGLYPALTGMDAYAEVRPVLRTDADRAAFDEVLEQLAGRLPGTSVVSYEETDRQLLESEAQIHLLAWGLILFIGLIGLLNIVNTVYTNIHTRVSEIGIQRAIGMSTGSLFRVFLWEGVDYGLFAAAVGGAAGYAGTLLTEAAVVGEFRLAAVPLLSMLQAAICSIGACILATCIPLRRVSRMSIVDAIETVE